MKKVLILSLLLLIVFSGCTTIQSIFSKPSVEAQVVDLDSLQITPETEKELAKLGVTLTKLNDKQVLLTQPAKKQGKTKYKNSFNTDNSQKKSNNSEVSNKKSGNTDSFNDNKKQGQNSGNTDNKKQGQTKSTDYSWIVWIAISLVILYQFWPDIRTWIRKMLSAAYGFL